MVQVGTGITFVFSSRNVYVYCFFNIYYRLSDVFTTVPVVCRIREMFMEFKERVRTSGLVFHTCLNDSSKLLGNTKT